MSVAVAVSRVPVALRRLTRRSQYVKLAFHGFTELSREQRLGVYAEGPLRESYDEPEYALLDTLFSLGETFLFCQLVEWKDAHPEVELPAYARMHKDVRTAVDMCHRDGSLKRVVASDPARFIYADPNLVPLLEMLRASGRKTFIVTNSLWDYTHVVMNYLCDGRVGADKRLDWLARFDCVITGSAKPSFFENERASIFAVDPATGHLRNTDNGAPLPHVGGDDPLAAGPPCAAPELLEACEEAEAVPTPPRIFQGGCYRHLHAMLGIASGSRVLYGVLCGAGQGGGAAASLALTRACCLLQWATTSTATSCAARRRSGGAPRWWCRSWRRSCGCWPRRRARATSLQPCAQHGTPSTTSCSASPGRTRAAGRARRRRARAGAAAGAAAAARGRGRAEATRSRPKSRRSAPSGTRCGRCTARG